MKLRKLFSTALAMALGLSLTAPAMAAEAADGRLAEVAGKVIATLSIPEDYTAFHGEPSETPLGPKWALNWEGEGKTLTVSATEAGKVLSLNYWEEQTTADQDKTGPSFPNLNRAQAQEKAQALLDLVLTEGEEAVFEQGTYSDNLSVTNYSFGGSIRLNGLATPLNFSVRVRAQDGVVTAFWRDDVSQYVGTVPAPATVTTADKAAQQLKGTFQFKLEYVLSEDQEGEEKVAVLRYLPQSTHEFYVDAATGELVDLTELREHLRETGKNGFTSDMATGESAVETTLKTNGRKLTEAELAGVAKLEGVLTQDQLDKAIRAWKELGLDKFEVAGSNLNVEREGEKVTARVTYARNTEEGIARRYVTLDGRTGALEGMWGSEPYDDSQPKVDQKAAQKAAEAFLKALWPDQFAKCELYDSYETDVLSGAHSFTFAQKVNGYFFPANSLTVRISARDSSVMGFDRSFDDAVTFDDPKGIVDLAAAEEAWLATYPVELAYIQVPVALDLLGAEVLPLRNAGYTYYNALKPGYVLGERDNWYYGVDAKSGQPVSREKEEKTAVTYDDLAGHWAEKALSELAQFGVGWYGGKAMADEALTQIDYVAFLASAEGYRYLPGEDEKAAADSLYNYAYRRGILTPEERADQSVLTRSQAVKLLLDSLGYGKVARIPNIFRCDFADAAAIADADMGYAALAQGLGVVTGDSEGNYAAARPANRCEGAVMLWQYMKH